MQGEDSLLRWRPPIGRRSFLGAAATLGAASGLGLSSSSVAAIEIDDDWVAEADDRIREHRTADFEVLVTDADGNDVDGATVDVEMQTHEYGFGVAINASTLLEENDDSAAYREHVLDLFNKAVLENHHKWRFFEADQELADDATEWLLEQGLSMRGHACLWANVDGAAVPSDVVDAMGVDDDSSPDPEYVHERSFAHLEEIIEHYGDDIDEWDVVNEVVHEPSMIEAIEGESVDPVEAPVLAEWYQTAADLRDDLGVGLDVNDYNTIEGPYENVRSDYRRQIEFLQDEGVGLDGIGLQSHFNEDSALDPEEIMAGLDLYAAYDADIRITEFDTADDEWDDEAKGEFLYTFLKIAFSHPATTDFLLWGFWDGNHWLDDAPLFYEDWTPKPGYDAYTGLVFDEWWTEVNGETDGGRFETTGFKGEYEVTARYDSVEETTVATFVDDGDSLEIQLDVDADGEPDSGDDGTGNETSDDSDGGTGDAGGANDGDDTGEDDGDEAGSENDGDGTDDSTPGMGVLSALAGIASLAGYTRLRDDDAES